MQKSEIKKAVVLFATVFGISTLLVAGITLRGTPSWIGIYKCCLSGLTTAFLWVGNASLGTILRTQISWLEMPLKRFLFTLLLTFVYTLFIWVLTVLFWDVWEKGIAWELPIILLKRGGFWTTLFITMLITIFMHGRAFLLEWRQAAAEAERLKKEQMTARFELLKNQVNPHFLFNSLNVLTTLVHKDADQAERFIRQLSAVYRYVLDSRNQELAPLSEELNQLESYIFLMKIRFGEAFEAHLPDQESLRAAGERQIIPLSLQMLVENAIKHNEVSKAAPLHINISLEADYVYVRNKIQPRTIAGESSGVGLDNIRARNQFITDKPVVVRQTEGLFEVGVPLV